MSVPRTVRAAVLHAGGRRHDIREVGLDPPRRGEVEVQVHAAGVCHSDLSVVDGVTPARFPVVVGHEAAGVVCAVGEGVTGVAAGDHVVLSWVATCRRCYQCTHGQPQLCLSGVGRAGVMDDGETRLRLDGGPLHHGINVGAFAERVVIRETAVVRIDPTIPFEHAALAGCAVVTGVGAALRAGGVRDGERVLVIGCGGVGLSAVQGARIGGASAIIAVDPVRARREAALRLGATLALAPGEDLAAAVRTATERVGPDLVIECAGHPALQRQAFDLARRGGRVVLVGLAPQGSETAFPSVLLTIHEKTIRGCFHGSCDPQRDVPWILDLAARGQLELDALISRRLPLEGLDDALEAMRRGDDLRCVLMPAQRPV